MNINKLSYYGLFVMLLAVTLSYACSKETPTNMADAAATIKSDSANHTQTTDENAFTPIVMSVLAPPVPVLGSDGKYHLSYELFLTNASTFDWQVVSIEVLDGAAVDTVLDTVSGEQVTNDMQQVGTRQPVNMLDPTQSGLVFITFSVDAENIPDSLVHRLTITGTDGLPPFVSSFLQLPKDQKTLSELGARFDVLKQDVVVLGAPFKGKGWVAVNGCCDSYTHMRSALTLNGQIFISQRYAIDWMQIDEENRLYVGNPQDLNNWVGYNADILAVSDARVVTVVDQFEDQIPFVLPTESGAITLEQIDGNHVILALPNGQYVFYAHLKSGSILVKEGDTVTKGQVIAKLGNTGNTSAPHLHLHIMQTASSLGSNGLPHVFEEYKLTGLTTDESFFDKGLEDNTPFVDEDTDTIVGNSIDILPAATSGIHTEDLPLNLNIVEFQ
ncbi:MAG: M23 family metallopeptidase [Thermodesulfobacteriota bacterium]